MNRRLNAKSALFTALTALAATVALAGCSSDQASKSIEQAQEAPGAYGNAINRAKAVAGTEQEHQSAGYLNRKTGGALGGDSAGGNVNAGDPDAGK